MVNDEFLNVIQTNKHFSFINIVTTLNERPIIIATSTFPTRSTLFWDQLQFALYPSPKTEQNRSSIRTCYMYQMSVAKIQQTGIFGLAYLWSFSCTVQHLFTYNLFVTSKIEFSISPILQFSNLKCQIKAKEPFKTIFWWCISSYLLL